ncbi:hypothetical protein NXS19_008525 [Fusarium pseudograminearum]|nr:hypothetical protein NXS19_008525 [Fusarium pseudograminearum]
MAKRTWSDSNPAGINADATASPAPARPNGHGRTSSGRQSISGIISTEASIPQISRKIKACAACRKHKIKCLMDESGPPCRRCSERNLGCVLSKSLQTIIDEKSQFSESVVQDLEQMHNALRQVMTKLSLPELPPYRASILETREHRQKTTTPRIRQIISLYLKTNSEAPHATTLQKRPLKMRVSHTSLSIHCILSPN